MRRWRRLKQSKKLSKEQSSLTKDKIKKELDEAKAELQNLTGKLNAAWTTLEIRTEERDKAVASNAAVAGLHKKLDTAQKSLHNTTRERDDAIRERDRVKEQRHDPPTKKKRALDGHEEIERNLRVALEAAEKEIVKLRRTLDNTEEMILHYIRDTTNQKFHRSRRCHYIANRIDVLSETVSTIMQHNQTITVCDHCESDRDIYHPSRWP